ncbi:WD repeat protein [Aspergillus sclerotioniger CBS 115572]|uniref:WD repeat protein n=1 Tax=Aspergillus sclerotioniger CBS 115572 TaxID=1450535 RepID=A0A317WKU4_9EURO|nr:WD repeat protein [Aspergillus sclerotioniger CBS 115572]PWY86331.1 WD repeat protein [Aspergillus sclerotioniger CBS 115572]
MSRISTPQGPEDLSVIEEAQVLLSHFMRNSSRETRGSPAGNRSDQDSTSGECAGPEKSLWKNARKHDRLTRTPIESRSPSIADGKRRPISSALRTPDSLNPSEQNKRNTPSSPGGGGGREIPGARRSRRTRTGPTNYYDKTNYLGFGSDEDVSDSHAKSSPTTSRQTRFSSNTPASKPSSCINDRNGKSRVIYSSPHVQILKSPFESLDDLGILGRAYYSSARSPAEYAKKYQSSPPSADEILHVDFDQTEMSAILELFSFFGFQPPESLDVALSDQIIQIASIYETPRNISKKIWRICELAQILSDNRVEGVDDSHTWLSTSKQDQKDKNKRQTRRLVRKTLGLSKSKYHDSELLCSDNKLRRLSRSLPFASILSRRRFDDINAFIDDARQGSLASSSCFIKATASNRGSVEVVRSLNKILQRRELGVRVTRQLCSTINEDFKLAKTWKGASNDVIVLAWAPDGTQFAAGATAQCDEHNLEYNRNNNLVVGDVVNNRLTELPDHWVSRPSGRAATSRTVYDDRLWMSVTSIEWWDDALFTASYDNTVKMWNTSNQNASCFRTLRHDSKVEVMARSNFEGNLLATGTRSIGLWRLADSIHSLLELPRGRSRKDRELVPTSLAWGAIKATGNILLAGMCERDDGMPQTGLLAGWHIGEASTTPMQFSPNSQNMFDIKWHPTLPIFAAATSVGHGPVNKNSKETRSFVRLYQPLSSRTCTMEFECPALDINEVNICPRNPNYVTASCTDGVTYVWDHRRPDHIIHKLRHGEPLNQVDETISREQADVGVRIALWGDRIDEFYTGASDGVLKKWDILRAPENVLVQDTAKFEEEIMCGAFSKDRSNLLIGDSAGGIHLLSPGPFSSTEGLSMDFKPASQPQMRLHRDGYGSGPESGIRTGAELLSSGKLVRHPIYGVGQGPCYDGPFAAWARPEDTPPYQIARTRLKDEVQLRQLHGVRPECRIGLDQVSQEDIKAQIKLAHIRNQQRYNNKRTREGLADPACASESFIDLVDDRHSPSPSYSHRPKRRMDDIPPASGVEVIDLTGDTDTEENPGPKADIHFAEFKTALEELGEELEEDFWWPSSGTIDANIQDVDGV